MDDNVEIYLTNQTQGKLEKVYICGYSKDAQVVNNYEFNYLLDVENPQDGLIKKITSNEKLSEIYDYDIYYYGFDSLKIQIGNEKMDLEQALVEGKVTMEQIIEQAERDRKAGIIGSDMYKEGGTMIYFYGTYTIIKKHTVDGNRDVYIGMPEMRLNTIKYETTN
jgi:hypothetical protein